MSIEAMRESLAWCNYANIRDRRFILSKVFHCCPFHPSNESISRSLHTPKQS